MGAWSSGPFDNDDAADLMIELEDAPSWDVVRETFADVLVNPDYVELSDGARAYAAAALHDRTRGRELAPLLAAFTRAPRQP